MLGLRVEIDSTEKIRNQVFRRQLLPRIFTAVGCFYVIGRDARVA
jgi:hypothetical protein